MTPPAEYVILVDAQDRELGVCDKLDAHINPRLHRAFSIFLFNEQGQLLLQQRAHSKYHGGGLWSNTCCSHPQPDRPIAAELARKLDQEMGLTADMTKQFDFLYRAYMGNGLTEYEYDHSYFGEGEFKPQPNPREVDDYRWVAPDVLATEMAKYPHFFTPWFRLLFPTVREHLLFQARA